MSDDEFFYSSDEDDDIDLNVFLTKIKTHEQEKNDEYIYDNIEDEARKKLKSIDNNKAYFDLFNGFILKILNTAARKKLNIAPKKKLKGKLKIKHQNYQKHILFNCIREQIDKQKKTFEEDLKDIFSKLINITDNEDNIIKSIELPCECGNEFIIIDPIMGTITCEKCGVTIQGTQEFVSFQQSHTKATKGNYKMYSNDMTPVENKFYRIRKLIDDYQFLDNVRKDIQNRLEYLQRNKPDLTSQAIKKDILEIILKTLPDENKINAIEDIKKHLNFTDKIIFTKKNKPIENFIIEQQIKHQSKLRKIIEIINRELQKDDNWQIKPTGLNNDQKNALLSLFYKDTEKTTKSNQLKNELTGPPGILVKKKKYQKEINKILNQRR